MRRTWPRHSASTSPPCRAASATSSSLGLIERIEDPDDGRARLLRLTTTGATGFNAMRIQRQTEFRAILARWDSPDLAALATLLSRLNSDLGLEQRPVRRCR